MPGHITDPTSKRRHSGAAIIGVIVLLSLAVTWLWAHEGHAPLPTKGAQVDVEKGRVVLSRESRDALDVQTAEVELRPAEENVLAYANLVAPWQQHAYVTTRLPGRIVRLYVKPGQAVAAGQPLAEVQSLELENLQLEVVNAQNDIQLSTKILEQMTAGEREGTVSGKIVQEARSKHRENVNALEVATSKWLSLGLGRESLDRLLRELNPRLVHSLPILSPIRGLVIHADLAIGKVVEPTEHLFEIVDLSSVWVQIGVLEKDLHRIVVGQPVELTLAAYPGEIFRGTVQVKGPYLDPQTHVGTVWAELTNPPGREPRFLPGMYGQAHVVVSGSKKRVAVPAAALLTNGTERFVLVEESATASASEYQKRNVVVETQTPEFAQIVGGVFPGDRIVTTGGHVLANFFVQGVLRPSEEAKKNMGVRVELVQPQVVEDVIQVDGSVEVPPDRRALGSSQLAGTLQRIHVERGQAVRAGDILGEVASLELQELQLGLLKAHLQIGLLEELLQGLRRADQVLARRQVWETESLYNAAVNRRDSVKRKLESAGLSPEQVQSILAEKKLVETLPLRAPIDGVVSHFSKVLGQVIKAEEPLFEIHDLSRVWVQGYLSERDLPGVHVGQRARVRLVADPRYLGDASVVRSGQVFGSENRTLSVWMELDQRASPVLQHNMLARLTLTVRQPAPTPAVPLPAVLREGTRAYVFVFKSDGLVERRPVEIGRADDRYVEVTSGLELGESVSVQGTHELQTAYASLR